MEHADVVIAGGGIIGSAIAWALAARGMSGITVVDFDLAGHYASSELNAGGARATWWQRVNIATCAASLNFFRDHAEEFGFHQTGYLWLFDDAWLFGRARAKVKLQNQYGLDVQAVEMAEVLARFPIINRGLDRLVGATFSPRDGLLNANAVRQWYRREATELGVRFLDHRYIEGVSTRTSEGNVVSTRAIDTIDLVEVHPNPRAEESELCEALTAHHLARQLRVGEEQLSCGVLINCLGAWSPVLAAKLGLVDPTRPVRRQVSLCDVRPGDRPPDVDLSMLGMIVDSSNVYFHPEGSHFLAGYSIPDEPAGYDFHYDGSAFFQRYVWPALAGRCSMFERCAEVGGWAGLYEVTPDRSGIAGRGKDFTNLFEAHSFTGRGVMQSYGIAIGMAELIATGRFETLDLSPLSVERFSDERRWQTEDLHI